MGHVHGGPCYGEHRDFPLEPDYIRHIPPEGLKHHCTRREESGHPPAQTVGFPQTMKYYTILAECLKALSIMICRFTTFPAMHPDFWRTPFTDSMLRERHSRVIRLAAERGDGVVSAKPGGGDYLILARLRRRPIRSEERSPWSRADSPAIISARAAIRWPPRLGVLPFTSGSAYTR
jgi:hypothetical protein